MMSRRVFATTNADSGALQALEAYGHRFTEPGRFRIAVREDEIVVARHALEVSDDRSASTQLTFDVGRSPGSQSDCGCSDFDPSRTARTLAVGGVALWWTSGVERKLSISGVALEATTRDQAFDSRELGEGDVFSRVLLRPGQYRLANRLSGAEGRVVVTNPRHAGAPDRKPGIAQSAVRVICGDRGFEPAEIEIERGQGVAWFVVGSTRYRITVELVSEQQAPALTT